MHAAKIYVENYANGKNPQVDTTRHSHPPTASYAYQQLSDAARLLAARVPLHSACAPAAYRLHPSRTYQFTYNR